MNENEYSRVKIKRAINNKLKELAINLSTDTECIFVQDLVELALLKFLQSNPTIRDR